jgi:predicted AlkP superfamily phosphohydrolase/phosphomutase
MGAGFDMANNTRTLIVGLDGLAFEILEPMRQEGLLPNIDRLIRQGATGPLRSTYPPITGTAWTSFMTGRNPGKHGVYGFMRRTPGSYLWEPCPYNSVQPKTMWEALCAAGKRVGIVNMPMTFPPRISNGIMVSGMNAPSERARISDPPELMERLNQVAGGYRLDVNWADFLAEGGSREDLLESLIALTRMRTKAALGLVAGDRCDVFALVYVAMDRIQHSLWDHLGVDRPLPEDAEGRRIAGLCRQVYAAADEGIGQLIEAFGDGADVILMSDHGFGPITGWTDLNDVLQRHGLLALKRKSPVREAMVRIAYRLGIQTHSVRRVARSLGMAKTVDRAIESTGGYFGRYDWSRTRAYSYDHNDLHINLAGRDPQGIVGEPEYEAARRQVMDIVLALREEGAEAPLVTQVSRREDIYSGEFTDLMPDMVVTEHKPGHMLVGMVYRSTDDRSITKRDLHTGAHTPDGIYVAAGPSFRPGARAEGARLIDLHPTVLATHGVPVSSDVDGRPLVETMAERFSEPGAIRTTDEAAASLAEEEPAISDEEKDEMAERLRGLGYME